MHCVRHGRHMPGSMEGAQTASTIHVTVAAMSRFSNSEKLLRMNQRRRTSKSSGSFFGNSVSDERGVWLGAVSSPHGMPLPCMRECICAAPSLSSTPCVVRRGGKRRERTQRGHLWKEEGACRRDERTQRGRERGLADRIGQGERDERSHSPVRRSGDSAQSKPSRAVGEVGALVVPDRASARYQSWTPWHDLVPVDSASGPSERVQTMVDASGGRVPARLMPFPWPSW